VKLPMNRHDGLPGVVMVDHPIYLPHEVFNVIQEDKAWLPE
jgi:hypothetical protein